MCVIRTILTALFLCGICAGQSEADVIINDYTRVTSIATVNCRSFVTVDSIASFAASDRIFVIQTGGCTEEDGYDVAAVGRCEFNTIGSISGTVIELAFPLVNTYDTCGTIQVIRVPEFTNHTFTEPITGRAWDGRVGGLIVIDVRGTLTLGASITADGIGFRGGITWPGGGDCSSLVDDDVANSRVGAAKGETYARPLPTMVAGGRALFSGGGGGRAHNSGGGGGGNGGRGGQGGSQWQGCGSYFDNGGRPGISAAPQLNGQPILCMGGGGGAGHMNNNSGTAGARGGGIIVIRCDTLVGQQGVVSARGLEPAVLGGNDGAGGGGAGGAIHLQSQAVIGPVDLIAHGGAGGNMNNGGLHGPGGGGGGGSLLLSLGVLPPTVRTNLDGGRNGRNIAITDPQGSEYLAEGGQSGVIVLGVDISENRTVPRVPTVTAAGDSTLCVNDSIILDCVLSERADSVRWYNARGSLVGVTSRVTLRAVQTDTFTVRAYGTGGCFTMDTVVISVRPPWNVSIDSINLGTIRCDRIIDTALIVRHRGLTTAQLRYIVDPESAAQWISVLPDSLQAGDSSFARIRVVPDGRQGAGRAVLQVQLSPCDTLITGIVTWQRDDRRIDVLPDTVTMPELEVCRSERTSREVDITLTGADVVVEDILTDSVASTVLVRPFLARSGQAFSAVITWTPTRTRSLGRIGFVVRDSACVDTLWMTVTGTVRAPFLIAPDVVYADTVILCRDTNRVVPINISADTATTWIIDSIECSGPGYAVSSRGDSLRGSDSIVVVAVPTAQGRYDITVRVRLLPCDTVITVHVQGIAVDVAMLATPLISFTEPLIGRQQILQATYTNIGTTSTTVRSVTVPTDPFRILRTQPTLPTQLRPGESITIDVAYVQTFGTWADSIVLESTDPCPILLVTQLRGTGRAITRVRIPDITGDVGQTVNVPILLQGIPEIDRQRLDSFDVRFAWKASEALLTDGTNGASSWITERTDDSIYVRLQGTWNGTDTLTTVPMLLLLSATASTDLVFDRNQGFAWRGQQSDVEYDDGLLMINDVCSGRLLRSIRFGVPFRPMIAPLPASESITVTVPPASGSVSVSIFTLHGGMLHHTQQFAAQTERYTVNIGDVPVGLHIMRITSAAGTADVPLVIHR